MTLPLELNVKTTTTFDDGMSIVAERWMPTLGDGTPEPGALVQLMLHIRAANGDDPTLNCVAEDPKPAEFSLHYWHLADEKTMELAIERTFSVKVASLRWEAGQGHGVVWVTYEE